MFIEVVQKIPGPDTAIGRILRRIGSALELFMVATLVAVIYLIIAGVLHGKIILPFSTGIELHGAWDGALRYPWTDMAENVITGFNMSNGLEYEHGTVIAHLPGVAQYLALAFRLFGIWRGTPSPELMSATYTVAAVAVAFMQLTACYLTLRLLLLSKGISLLLSVAWLTFCAFAYDIIMPMSENIIPFLFALQFAAFQRMVMGDDSLHWKLTVGAWTMTLLPLINLLIGLTIAPSVAVLCLAMLAVAVWIAVGHGREAWKAELRQPMVWAPVLICIAILVYEVSTTRLSEVWFWNFETNRYLLAGSTHDWLPRFLPNAWSFGRILSGKAYIGATAPELYFAIAVFLASFFFTRRPQRIAQWSPSLIVATLAVICFHLALWRTDHGYKSEGASGLFWLLLVWSAVAWWPRLTETTLHRASLTMTIVGGFAVLSVVVYLASLNLYIDTLPNRAAAYDEANVCRFRSTEPCRCLQVTTFGPQIFLRTDVRQCPDRFSTFVPSLFWVPRIKQTLLNDLERNDIAFQVYPDPAYLNIFKPHSTEQERDPVVMNAFFGGGLQCVNGPFKVCWKN